MQSPLESTIEASGTVAQIDGEYAIVHMDQTGCGRCHEEGGCGGHNLGNLLCRSVRSLRVANPGQARVGDRVRIAVADGALRRSASLAYGLPLLMLLGGALAGSAAYGEGGAMLGALGGLSIAWFALHMRTRFGSPKTHAAQPFIRY